MLKILIKLTYLCSAFKIIFLLMRNSGSPCCSESQTISRCSRLSHSIFATVYKLKKMEMEKIFQEYFFWYKIRFRNKHLTISVHSFFNALYDRKIDIGTQFIRNIPENNRPFIFDVTDFLIGFLSFFVKHFFCTVKMTNDTRWEEIRCRRKHVVRKYWQQYRLSNLCKKHA